MSSSTSNDLYFRLLAGAGGGFVAESLTLPTDVCKVRLQVQQNHNVFVQTAQTVTQTVVNQSTKQQISTQQYSGMIDCGLKIYRNEGVRSLWKGYTPAILRQVSYSSLMMVIYEPVRDGLNGIRRQVQQQTQTSETVTVVDNNNSFLLRLLAGGIAGGTSIAIFNPFEVAKTKIQTFNSTTVTQTPTVRSVFQDVVYGKDGMLGLWSGVKPNVMRTFLVNAAELGTYDQAKEYIVKNYGPQSLSSTSQSSLSQYGSLSQYLGPDNMATHVISSGIAGFASACISTPVDVVKTRLMNDAGSTNKQYEGIVDAFQKITTNEGPNALYKGFVPICVRKLLWVTAFFVCYERIRGLKVG